MSDVKNEVRQFYDQIGWQLVDEDIYQNARYEDLRPVSQEYINRCHMRVMNFIGTKGQYFLDAGSGPIQYPQYLHYSRNHRYRVCADVSITALKQARQRIGDHGLFVVADISNLPFLSNLFDSAVCLHTIHHLPSSEHLHAYSELHRVIATRRAAVVVQSWSHSPLMRICEPAVRLAIRLKTGLSTLAINSPPRTDLYSEKSKTGRFLAPDPEKPKGTHIARHDSKWLKKVVGEKIHLEIMVWRSVNVRFLRALIHPRLGGRYWLRFLFWMEEHFPHFLGENGQYPLIVIYKQLEA